MIIQNIKAMTLASHKPALHLAALLFCSNMFTSVLQASSLSEIRALTYNESPHQADTLSSSELIVTLHPLSTKSIAENNYRQALIYIEQNDVNTAQSTLWQALRQDNTNILARELLVSLLLTQNNFKAAISVLETGIAVTPTHSKFPLWLAQTHIKLGAFERALTVLEKNITRFRQQSTYLGALANFYQQNERHNDARDYYLQALKLTPQDNRWWIGLGMTAEELNDWSGAQTAYQRAKENSFMDDPLLPFVQQRLSMMRTQLQQ